MPRSSLVNLFEILLFENQGLPDLIKVSNSRLKSRSDYHLERVCDKRFAVGDFSVSQARSDSVHRSSQRLTYSLSSPLTKHEALCIALLLIAQWICQLSGKDYLILCYDLLQ